LFTSLRPQSPDVTARWRWTSRATWPHSRTSPPGPARCPSRPEPTRTYASQVEPSLFLFFLFFLLILFIFVLLFLFSLFSLFSFLFFLLFFFSFLFYLLFLFLFPSSPPSSPPYPSSFSQT